MCSVPTSLDASLTTAFRRQILVAESNKYRRNLRRSQKNYSNLMRFKLMNRLNRGTNTTMAIKKNAHLYYQRSLIVFKKVDTKEYEFLR